MKAIILAAGKGSRISSEIGGMPKSMLPLTDGTPIIAKSISMLVERGIKPVVCVGYKKDMITEGVNQKGVTYYYNPFYGITNNIASLWFALREFTDEDILLASADLYYPGEFIDMLKGNTSDFAMVVDSSRIETGDFYFHVENGKIIEYGPEVVLNRRDFEYMGLIKIGKKLVPDVRKMIEQYIESEKFDRYFEDMLIYMNQNCGMLIDFIDVKGHFWREFDFFEDYKKILEFEKEQHMDITQPIQVKEFK